MTLELDLNSELVQQFEQQFRLRISLIDCKHRT